MSLVFADGYGYALLTQDDEVLTASFLPLAPNRSLYPCSGIARRAPKCLKTSTDGKAEAPIVRRFGAEPRRLAKLNGTDKSYLAVSASPIFFEAI